MTRTGSEQMTRTGANNSCLPPPFLTEAIHQGGHLQFLPHSDVNMSVQFFCQLLVGWYDGVGGEQAGCAPSRVRITYSFLLELSPF